MKQVIEIEVPDGKKAVWNNGKIEFIDVNIIERLRNSKDPEKYLMDMIAKEIHNGDDTLFDLYNEYMDSPDDTNIESIAKLKLFLAYLNKGHKFDLVFGNVYYPCVKFYLKDKFPKNEVAVGKFKYKGKEYVLVGNYTYINPYSGLASFRSSNGVGSSSFRCGFLACKDIETAQFVATTFSKLLFDVNFGSLVDYEWLE